MAIVGRTGCGKSTFLQSLLRLNIISQGEIFVDGASLLHMPLEDARSLVSVIPQDPHLFSGTVRFNLDPFTQYRSPEVPYQCPVTILIRHRESLFFNFFAINLKYLTYPSTSNSPHQPIPLIPPKTPYKHIVLTNPIHTSTIHLLVSMKRRSNLVCLRRCSYHGTHNF